MIFNNFADQDWIEFFRIRIGLGLKTQTQNLERPHHQHEFAEGAKVLFHLM